MKSLSSKYKKVFYLALSVSTSRAALVSTCGGFIHFFLTGSIEKGMNRMDIPFLYAYSMLTIRMMFIASSNNIHCDAIVKMTSDWPLA